jgi:hypothetical protein
MKRWTIMVILGLLASTAWGEQQPTPLRLVCDIVDGSKVIGVPNLESLPLRTSYAAMDIPLDRIRQITVGNDTKTVLLTTRNGDRLKGTLGEVSITLTTVFGKVTLEPKHLKNVAVLGAGLDLTTVTPTSVTAHDFSANVLKAGYEAPLVNGLPVHRFLLAHAASTVSFKLDGTYRRFSAQAIIYHNNGAVKFLVKADDKVLYTSPEMKGKTHQDILVDIPEDAKVLQLIVDPLGDISCDHAFWVDPILEK